ncbi:type II secretion system protein M [Acinetobacter sp. TGL-Y2]|uniref:type II secretion system protein GspM n=1 Tax=Acinetobacter sp. TGL-Y2 TaxID=1407071 RepID=UPI0007A67763|nr:type II secretion system protein GspM [Acinetobacter sp. TGL-Y2]AMW79206.1 type II secretion system protein M [Acinetobacter sp. TGL-Y2]
MNIIDKAQQKMDHWIERVGDYLARLSLRERIMVITATVLVTVAIIGSALWNMHRVANEQQQRLNELKDTLVWMQSNVIIMKPANDLNLTPSDKIQRAAQQQGLSVASQQMDGKIQIVAEHINYSILANFLTQLAQMGLSIEKLELNKVGGQIKLTAAVK